MQIPAIPRTKFCDPRVLRLITAVPTLKTGRRGLLAARPGIGSIALLIGLIYYVFPVIFIVVMTFMVFNLFIGVVVNAMQAEVTEPKRPNARRSAR